MGKILLESLVVINVVSLESLYPLQSLIPFEV